jgi:hypothetical protein
MKTHEQQYPVSFWEWQPSGRHVAWTEHGLVIPTLRAEQTELHREAPTGSKRIVGARRVAALAGG